MGVLKPTFHPSYSLCPLLSTSHNVQRSSFSKNSFLRDLRVRAHLLQPERTVVRVMVTTAVWHEKIGQLVQPKSFHLVFDPSLWTCASEFGMVKKMKGELKKMDKVFYLKRKFHTQKQLLQLLVKYITLVTGPVFNNFSLKNTTLMYDFMSLQWTSIPQPQKNTMQHHYHIPQQWACIFLSRSCQYTGSMFISLVVC